MELSILSERCARPRPGWDPIIEFEDVAAQACDAKLIAPQHHRFWRRPYRRLLRRYPGPYVRQPRLHASEVPDVLLVVACTPVGIAQVQAIPGWRRSPLVIAYVIDSFDMDQYPAVTRQLDHVFTPIDTDASIIERRFGVPTSVIPVATDVMRQPDDDSPRPIDLVAYGRQPYAYLESFRSVDDIIFRDMLPGVDAERHVFWEELRRAKLAAAFNTLTPVCRGRIFTHSILTPRWFEALAAGCIVIGRRPRTPLADRILCWEDATIELPDADASPTFVRNLLNDAPRLTAARERNREHLLRGHDWRHRLRDMFEVLGLPLPGRLAVDLQKLEARVGQGTRNRTSDLTA